MIFSKVIIFAAVLACSAGHSSTPDWIRLESDRPKLGTLVRIVLYTTDSLAGVQVLAEAYQELDRINAIISDYDPHSELSRLNRLKTEDTIALSPVLTGILAASRSVFQLSSGAFDPTVKPLVDYWREIRKKGKPLRMYKVRRLKRSVGFDQIFLDPAGNRMAKGQKNMTIDLGGIGKGYLGDCLIHFLAQRGFTRAMIDLGGDLVAGDPPPGQKGWAVGFTEEGDCQFFLNNQALAGSGGTYQFIERRGKRYSHIIDPRTGLGITAARSAFVLARNGASADAWASALTVLGAGAGNRTFPVVWQLTDDQLTLASPDINEYLHCKNEQ